MKSQHTIAWAATWTLALVALAGCGSEEPPEKPATPSEAPRAQAAAPEVEPVEPVAQERWDFYIGRVNDQPASVALDFAYGERAPIAAAPYLLWISLPMAEPDRHGMGSGATADRMQPIEDALAEGLKQTMQALYVGRIRGEGTWRLFFFAPSATGLEDEVRAVLKAWPEQTFDAGTRHDPEWSYYLEFLWPDAERAQWMKNARLCAQLEKHGDVPSMKRPVDHFIYFPTEQARADFEKAIADLAFKVLGREKRADADDPRPFTINVEREDPVELERIHAVVMKLIRAAESVGGLYDGWGCVIRKAEDADK